MRTKSEWKAYYENSLAMLENYEEQNPINNDFFPERDSQIQIVKEKLKEALPMLKSKTEGDLFNDMISGDREFASISEDFDEWSIYFLAHKVSLFT